MSLKKILILFCCFLSITSCIDNLDFSQIDDYSATPAYTGSLIYFKALPFQFFNQAGIQESEITDITDFRVFENNYLRNYIVKIDFNAEIKNEINKNFTIQIDFLDSNNSTTHRFQDLVVNANDLNYKFEETVELSSNTSIKNTTRVRIIVKINNPTPPLDSNDTSEFEFKSSIKIYIDTND